MKFFYLIRKYDFFRLGVVVLTGALFGSVFFFPRLTIPIHSIISVSPNVAAPGELVTIVGKHFGHPSIHSWLTVGSATIKSEHCIMWDDTKIVFRAPEDLHEDLVRVVADKKQSNAVMLVNRSIFPVSATHAADEALPALASLDTDTARIGDVITIYGKNFGHTRKDAAVLFTGVRKSVYAQNEVNEVLCSGSKCSESDFDYEFWSDREVRIRVPDAADTGDIVLITEAGISNPLSFRLKKRYGSKTYTDTRTYRLVAEVDVTHFLAEKPNTFFLRVPMPQKTATQRIVTIDKVAPDPFVPSYQDASIYRFYDVGKESNIRIRQEYSVSRSRVETRLDVASLNKKEHNNPLLYATYTEADTLIPKNDPLITKTCKQIVGSEVNPYNRARRIYTFLVSEIKVKEASALDASRSIVTALEEKNGSAYDLALLFCALARAASIPAIPTAGLLVSQEQKAVVHWWAEFYINGFGWVPVDPALAVGIPFDTGVENKDSWYFGNLDAYHIAFSRGYRIQTPMLANSKTTEKVRSYALRSIWEEGTANISGYSALWRIPKILEVY